MRRAALLVAMLTASPFAQAANVVEALDPAQTLNALQRVQDAIAAGDAKALPLQAELIAMMDRSFSASLNPGNNHTVEMELFLAYALAGGNRSVFASYVKRADLEPDDKELADAISAYVDGDVDKAQAQFEKVEAQTLSPRLAPLVALAKGTANLRKDAKAAIRNFDLARLMAPGTLVEEVALRRTVSLEAASGNGMQFLKAAEQYARRFILSPYAAQFAEAFVTGVVSMDETIPDASIAGVLSAIPSERRTALYLRLTRQAVIAGRLPRAAFAATEALKDDALTKDKARGAQVGLYAIIPDLTRGQAAQTRERLNAVDVALLPMEDRPLLKAARQIVEAIAQPFEVMEAPASLSPAAERASAGTADTPANAQADPIDQMIATNKQKLAAISALLEAAR